MDDKMYQFRLRQGQSTIRIDQQVPVGRGNIDYRWTQLLSFFGLFHP